jgi:hypothetical protein
MKKIIILLTSCIGFLTACKKTTDPIDVSNANVELKNAGTGFVVNDITVNPNDSIFFSYTVTSNNDMRYVSIQKNPANQTAFVLRDTLTTAQKNSFSAVKRLRADSINGSFIYHIVAHDKDGKYIGHKAVVVTVKSDYDYYTFRTLMVPDTTAKVNTCYMSAAKGLLYSYTTGAANSADIDFGLYYDTTFTASTSTTDDLRFSLYALSAAQPQLSYYDISTWTKNATVLKKVTSPAFNTLTSAGAIRTSCNTNLASGTSTKITQLVAGNMVAFRTAAGKRGVLLVNYGNGSSPAKESFLNVDIKIER